jgi:hypothetical protein
MADLSKLRFDKIGVEMTERAEVLVSFAYRFEEWDPNDERWGHLVSLFGILERGKEPEGDVDRIARIARAVIILIDAIDDLISNEDQTQAVVVGTLLQAAKIVDVETFALLSEMGAPRSVREALR